MRDRAPLIVDHGSRNNIRYNAAAADWTQRRDSLAGEGTAFMDTAHWLNSALRTKFETRAGNASTTYARLDFLFFEALSQFFDAALMDGTVHFSMKFCFLSLVGRRIGEASKYPDKELTDQDFARWLAKTLTELAAAGIAEFSANSITAAHVIRHQVSAVQTAMDFISVRRIRRADMSGGSLMRQTRNFLSGGWVIAERDDPNGLSG